MLSIIVGTLGLLLSSTFDVDDMRSVFRMIAQRVESVDTTFQVGVIGNLPSADIADFGHRPECDESTFEWTEVRFRNHGGQARIDRSPRIGIAQNSIWTGSAWIEWTNPPSVTAVRATPRSDMTTDCWGWFNLNDWPGVGGLGAISDVLAAARDVESQTTESQFILRFNQPNTKTPVEVIVDRTEPPRLRSITHRSGDGDANGINVVVHFQVETWEMYNGVYIPKEAYRLSRGSGFRGQDGEIAPPGASLVRFVRESITPIDADEPDLFTVSAINQSEVINDFRMRMSYRPGRSVLVFDGQEIETEAPISGFFGVDLPRLKSESRQSSAQSGMPHLMLTASLVALLCFGCFAVAPPRPSHAAGSGTWLIVVLLVAGSAMLTGYLIPRSGGTVKVSIAEAALGGETLHDFGRVIFEGKNVELSHEFVLTNTHSRPLTIAHVSASCGCASAAASCNVVGPGESASVRVVMRLLAPQRRRESVWVDCGADGVKTLSILAHVVRPTNVLPVEASVDLRRGEQALSFVVTSLTSDDEPRVPSLVVPETVEPEFVSWRMVCPRDEAKGSAAAWIGTFRLTPTPDFRGGVAVLSDGESPPFKVELTGRPWRPERLPDPPPAGGT